MYFKVLINKLHEKHENLKEHAYTYIQMCTCVCVLYNCYGVLLNSLEVVLNFLFCIEFFLILRFLETI